MPAMRHAVIGTAGHIDHGKTSLVKALTGIDCDRLPEERERGITIELGFAHLEDGDLQLHFVDVPGHERLVHTMIAGAAGIDLALLVVAADEGVMPQTREHLEVIRLMGVRGGAVALTKTDLVDSEMVELAAEEVREHLAGTPFADAPVIGVSATTGAGLAELRATLVALALAAPVRQIEGRPYRQAVDRVFTMTGAGTVVTGTSTWGALAVGEEVLILPTGLTARVRRLHVHGVERERVEAGERVAVNLAGLARDKVERGHQLVSAGAWRPTRLVTVALELVATTPNPLDEGDEVEVHALAARTPARVDRLSRRPLPPGQRAVAQLSLLEPLLLFPGDRLVLRRPAPVNTFAGGQVLDAHLRRVRRREAASLAELPPSIDRGAVRAGASAAAGPAGVGAEEAAARLGTTVAALEAPLGRLVSEKRIAVLATQPRRFLAAGKLERLADDAKAELARRLAGELVSAGIPARDFMASLLPRPASGLADVYLEELRQRAVLDLAEGRVVPAGSDRHMTAAGADLTRAIERRYLDGALDPPSPGEVATALGARDATVEGICRFLVQQSTLVRLEGKYLIHRSVLDEVARKVRAWEVDSFAVGEFKDHFALTRKLAIPILEWLDTTRVTLRVGDRRRVLRRPPG